MACELKMAILQLVFGGKYILFNLNNFRTNFLDLYNCFKNYFTFSFSSENNKDIYITHTILCTTYCPF